MSAYSIISAAEARKVVVDMKRTARVLAQEALDQVMADVDSKVRDAIKHGEMQANINLSPIARLVDINIEASKQCVFALQCELERLGYNFDHYTNHSHYTVIRWDR